MFSDFLITNVLHQLPI